MKINANAAVRLIVVASLLTCCVALVAAQQAPAGERRSLTDEGQSLLRGIEEARLKGRELMAELEGQEGADRIVTERQLADLRVGILQDLDRLTEIVLEVEKQGQDASTIRGPLASLMREVPSAIQRLISAYYEELAQLRAQRSEVAPAEQPGREKEIAEDAARIDLLVEAYAEHIKNTESLGLDASEDRAYLAESLTDRADTLVTRIRVAQEHKTEIEGMLKDAPDDADLKLELDAATIRLDGTIANLTSTIEVMKKLDLDTATYQTQLIQVTGDISTDILDTEVAMSLVGQWVSNTRQWVADNGAGLIFKIVVFILILLAFRVLANVVRKLMVRSMASAKVKVSKLLENMLTSMVSKIIMLFGLLVALSQMGFRLGPLLAGFGVAGIIIGFALQDSLSNFASGMMILFYRPFDVGDLVEAGGVFGRVSAMTLVSTTILTLDHQTLIVPNTKIWGDVIKNVTAQKVRRVDMTFGISYTDDIPKAEKVLESILEENSMVLEDPEPMVRLHNLGDSSVDFVVRPWVKTDDYWDVYWAVTREVKMRFDREGISIPFPQRDIHLYEEKKTTA